MALQDEIFDVMAALEGKPEADCFDRVLAHLNKLEVAANWSLTPALANAPAQAEQLRIDRHGNLYWSDRFKSWTKGVDTWQYSAIATDKVVASKTKNSI